MRFRSILAMGALAVGTLAGAASANAGIVLQDNFTGVVTPDALNWAGDAVFASLSGSVNASTDLVGPSNTYGITSYDGVHNVVDMDGTTGSGQIPSGILQSYASLPTGNYTVTFWLSGNQRWDQSNSVSVSIGGQTWTSPLLGKNAPWTFETVSFHDASGVVTFTGSGPSNNVGDLIGGVTVSAPEASTWAMMALGFAGLGFAGYRARRTPVAVSL